MYVHQGAGLIYLANPRTASRATAKALKAIGFGMVGSHHSGLRDVEDLKYFARLASMTSFTTVRDLHDTIRSWGRKLEGDDHHDPADEILRWMKEDRQYAIIRGWEPWTLFPHARYADHLLRYEHLEDDLNHLLEEHGLGPVELEVVR